MDINEDLEHALDRAVDGCVRILGLEKPDQEKVGLALAVARGYEPTKKKEDRKGKGKKEKEDAEKEREKKKVKRPRYYGFVPEVDLLELLNPVFSAGGDADVADGRAVLHQPEETRARHKTTARHYRPFESPRLGVGSATMGPLLRTLSLPHSLYLPIQPGIRCVERSGYGCYR
jgi:hypothetical protein